MSIEATTSGRRRTGKGSRRPKPRAVPVATITRRLEEWFADHARDLPWRRRVADDQERGYRTLVAEMMLQQTQSARVTERFEQFIQRFPTVEALADADEREVLAEWQGLGYYRRAIHLHETATRIVNKLGGRIPREAAALRELPGVGPYTAGAIASIAFDQRAAIVDGNVARVLARLFAIRTSVDRGVGRKRVWSIAGDLVAACRRPSALNQAMMELGSLVCTPASPQCGQCPLARSCQARRAGLVDRLPVPVVRAAPARLHAASVILVRAGRLLLRRRPRKGLWARMWELPTMESARPIAGVALMRQIRDTLQLSPGRFSVVFRFEHKTSHRSIHWTAWKAESASGRAQAAKWVRWQDLEEYPISNAQRLMIDRARTLYE